VPRTASFRRLVPPSGALCCLGLSGFCRPFCLLFACAPLRTRRRALPPARP